MLTAKKWRWFERLYGFYNRNLLRRHFKSLQVDRLKFENDERQIPTIIYLNHSSWWDAIVISELSAFFKFDSFVLMEEKHLRRFFLFRRLGAFSVERENPRGAIESLHYAAEILQNTARTLWIFPQGEILPRESRPLRFFRGTSYLIEKLKICRIVPIALIYEFRQDFKPEIFVKIGELEFVDATRNFERKSKTAAMENKMTALLDSLGDDIKNSKLENYQNILFQK